MYIENEIRRLELDSAASAPELPEELGYIIAKTVLAYLPAHPEYNEYMEVVGVLETVKAEVLRRAVATLHDSNIGLNGDIGFDDLPHNKGTFESKQLLEKILR